MIPPKLYVIGDTHWYHDNIVKYCDRPEHHNYLMVDNWVKTVREEDTVIHMGDIAVWHGDVEDKLIKLFKKLPGKKILIRGNHDKKTDEWYKENLGFEKVLQYMVMGDILFFHYPIQIDKYCNQKTINKINDIKKVIKKYNIKKIVHGHIHNKHSKQPNHFNCSVEVINYTPIEINRLLGE